MADIGRQTTVHPRRGYHKAELHVRDFLVMCRCSGFALGADMCDGERYRAPELLLGCKYGRGVDVWSIGCVFAEMWHRQPLFRGTDYLHQLRLILEALGPPSEADTLGFVGGASPQASLQRFFATKVGGRPGRPRSCAAALRRPMIICRKTAYFASSTSNGTTLSPLSPPIPSQTPSALARACRF